jgi:hypothetical protein
MVLHLIADESARKKGPSEGRVRWIRYYVYEDYRATFPPTDVSVIKESVKSEYTLTVVIKALLD